MPIRRSTRARTTLTSAPSPPAPVAASRPRRATPGSSVKVTRDESNSPDESKKALRLTMKMPSNKLREATSNPRSRPGSRGNAVAQLTDSLTGGEIVSGPRASRANKKYIVESESEDEQSEDEEEDEIQASEEDQEEEDEEEEEEVQIGGPEESDDEDIAGEDEDEDAEGEVDADGDIEMDDDADDGQPLPAQQPILKVNGPAAKSASKGTAKPTVTLTPAQADKVKSVEAKEIEMDDDDEELSELSEDDEGEAGEEDAEGDEDEELGDDDDDGSRSSTPDVSKMTKRQRSRLDQVMGSDFLQLPMEPQTKKHLTAEEHAMRRAEMARRRKNLSEKRNEEEKMDTINRLLKKQAPKRRGKISAAEITAQEHGGDETPAEQQDEEIAPANPVFVRWISDRNGCRLGVPGEWFGQPIGRVFGERKMVEEVEG